MSLLLPDSGLLFWMTIVFLVVFFILWRWGFPSIIKMVNERKNYIDESLAKAEEANLRLANIQKQGEELLMEAREKQAQILREASQTRDTIVEQAQEKAHEESARILSEAKAEIESQKQAAIRDIRTQVAELSVQIAEKILRKQLTTSAEQAQLIDSLLDEVASSNGTESK
ncbi:MAG: F0F1 ATP synthase subunit B [Prevotella sp.]|jgi:ATP synthase F0, B subunit|uniref:ATP synthase subunit b n=1 Tax=Prevotella vespertina TaxID=2608404 RepID=A0A7C9LUW3_9BACT|nr:MULTISPECIES: F0F1 ATP synthase subunit B [Prevotella]EID32794.1 ATP synthase F0, B subunit [Prevotella sp. oral taxon 306 str. F0472]MBF1626701.1 F0F1 ATP synthase subunit B [Prevotella sp.]MBF1637282.1 F0F1 ATP synthase subunit B [Prevotella sp.]MUL28779.1 F0F1 ATP synthase subunit B [Prevotella vespertina]